MNIKSKINKFRKNKKNNINTPSPYSKLATFLLCLFLGFTGIHRIYTRRYFSALLMAATFGYLFIGVIVDLYKLRKNIFLDWYGRPVSNIRTKGDQFAMLASFASPFLAYRVIPTALNIILSLGILAGEQLGFIDSPDPLLKRIQELRAKVKGDGIQTDIKAPEIPTETQAETPSPTAQEAEESAQEEK